MKHAAHLALRYMRHHKAKAVVMVAAVTLTLLLPMAVTVFVKAYEKKLGQRADATPMVVGAKGNRFDLVLQALYFRAGRVDTVEMKLVREIDAQADADAVPLHVRYTAGDAPVVGTWLDTYVPFRGLALRTGAWPKRMGQAVLGSAAAQRLGIGVGDTLTTDQQNPYDLAHNMPIRLRITGILQPTYSPDDDAVWVELDTAWLIGGHAHGHNPDAHNNEATHRAANMAVEVTDDNAHTFHFHGDPDQLPVSAIIVRPHTDKARTLLNARLNQNTPGVQALDPPTVMDELMGIVLQIKRFFDANLALVAAATAMLLGLIVTLSLKLRANERHTLHMLGCGRWLIVQTQAIELAIVLGASTLLALGLAYGLLALAPRLLGV
ncbi:MAG: ABC transporter permease [Phycisphaerales bacterium JB063]